MSTALSVVDDNSLPLCVDLDGTLITTDMLAEGLLGLATNIKLFGAIPAYMSEGRAGLKAYVAQRTETDASSLPYNQDVLKYIRTKKRLGQRIILVTASNISVAQSVADHLQLFDEVIASDHKVNLKGSKKADALVKRFGERQFVYMGDHKSDLEVWKHAHSGILVNPSKKLLASYAKLNIPILAVFKRDPISRYINIIRSLRPHQWAKNILVFVPILTASALTDQQAWIDDLFLFIAFCMTASAIYIINDLTDIAADRHHPRKRNRPFASGALDAKTGLFTALLLLIGGITSAIRADSFPIILIYATMSISYSARLKELALLDVFILTGLYTIRLLGGGVASHHHVSFWLLGFSGFMFLSLAIVKRVQECKDALKKGRKTLRRGYYAEDLPVLQSFGIGSTFASSVVLALYVQNETLSGLYRSPSLLWGIVPILLLFQCRLWLVTARGDMHDDPIVYAARDKVCWLIAFAAFLCLLLARSANYHLS